MIQSNDTALLVFSRSAEAEVAAKQFLHSGKKTQNTRIAQSLIDRVFEITKETGLPTFTFNEKQQTGCSFGEKLSNAIINIFNKGFSRLLIIGNDCPQLTSSIVTKACNQLQKNDVVLAPTKKGGLYLIGLSQISFDKNTIINMAWQTSHVFADWEKYIQKKSFTYFQLPELNDINNSNDLLRLISASSKLDAFRKLIISLLSSLYLPPACSSKLLFSFICSYVQTLRAPPSAICS